MVGNETNVLLGNYIPSITEDGYDAYPEMSFYGKFDMDELVNERENARLIGFYEGYYNGVQETKSWGTAVKAEKTILFAGMGYQYFISPTSLGDLTIRNAMNYIVYPPNGGSWIREERSIDGIGYYIYIVQEPYPIVVTHTYTMQFTN